MKSIFNSELKYYSDEEIINALNNNKNNIRLALTELMIINPKNDGWKKWFILFINNNKIY